MWCYINAPRGSTWSAPSLPSCCERTRSRRWEVFTVNVNQLKMTLAGECGSTVRDPMIAEHQTVPRLELELDTKSLVEAKSDEST